MGEQWETDDMFEQIAANDVLYPFYRGLGRYVTSMSTVGDARLFTLNINSKA